MHTVSITDTQYPSLLKNTSDPPKTLYYKGNWDPTLFDNCLAVVGTRRITRYGKKITQEIVSTLAARGITIVSGFMYGVDIEAHKAALSVGGKTIAVMPCGIEKIHPEYQKDIYNTILENDGLVISEWEGKHPALPWTFPRRNRIVAGLSQATLVMEAGAKSGSLITAKLARDSERKLFTVPHELTRPAGKGMQELLEIGAALIHSAHDILQIYDMSGDTTHDKIDEKERNVEGDLEQGIIKELKHDSADADSLVRTLGCSASELSTALSILILEGHITEEAGKYHVD